MKIIKEASDFFKKAQYDEVISTLKKLTKNNIVILAVDKLLGGAYFHQQNYTKALLHYKRIINKHNQNDVDFYFDIAIIYTKMGNDKEAIEYHLKAIEKDPSFLKSLQLLPKLYLDNGNKELAVSSAKKAIKVDPLYYKGYYIIARATKYTKVNKFVLDMENLFKNDISIEGKINLGFSLAKVYEEIGEYDKAFDALSIANKAKRSTFDFSAREYEKDMLKFQNFFTPAYIKKYKDKGYENKTPIFIVGKPRSGTSLTEQILASHPDVFGAGELTDFKAITDKHSLLSENTMYKDIGKEYIEKIRTLCDDSVYIVDKQPANFKDIPFILLSLPNAKIIHCHRDPMDNGFSLFKVLFEKGSQMSFDLSEIGETYLVYQNMMKKWHELFPGKIYDFKYEDLIANKEQETRKLLKYCELSWNDKCLDFHKTDRAVKTPSSIQVKTPLYNSSVNMWKNYEKYLKPLSLALNGMKVLDVDNSLESVMSKDKYNLKMAEDELKRLYVQVEITKTAITAYKKVLKKNN